MSDRRQLHARRGPGTDSSFSTPARAAASAFVWPTDRIASQQTLSAGNDRITGLSDSDSENVAPAPVRAHTVSPLSQFTRSPAGTSTSQSRSDAAADNEFRWISDYLHAENDADVGAGPIPQHARQVPRPGHPSTDVRLQPVGQPRSSPVPPGSTTHRPAVQPVAQPAGQIAGQAVLRRQHGRTSSKGQNKAASGAAAATSGPAAGTAAAAVAAGTAAAVAAAGNVAVAASRGAVTVGRWLGAAAGSFLDGLMGVDPNLIAGVDSLEQAGDKLPHMYQQLHQQRVPAATSVQQQAADNPCQYYQYRYMTRRRLQAIRHSQPDPQQTQQQQQGAASKPPQEQQGPANGSIGSQGWAWAVVLGIIALVSDAVTAVTTAYTDSLRPSAELLWHVAAVLFLYLMLPLLRLLLAAVKLLLQAFKRIVQVAKVPVGKKLQAAGAEQQQHPQQACDPRQKSAKLSRWPWGRTLSKSSGARTSRSAAAGATSEQQQLMLLAEHHLSNINNMYPGVLTLLDFDVLSSATAGFSSEQRLNPSSGYGHCAYQGSGLKGEPAAIHVTPLTTQQDVEAWCAAVAGLAQIQQTVWQLSAQHAAADSNHSGISALLPVLGVAIGTLPAAAAATHLPQQQQQLQPGCTVVGLTVIQLLELQPMCLVSLINDAGTPPAAKTEDALTNRLERLCTALKFAAPAATAVRELCAIVKHCMDSAAAGTAGAAGKPPVLAVLLQGTGCTSLAAALILGSSGGQETRLRLNPVPLLLARHNSNLDHALMLSTGLWQQGGAAAALQASPSSSSAAAGPREMPPSAALDYAGGCLRQLEQCVRDVQQLQPNAQARQSHTATAGVSSSSNNSSSSATGSSMELPNAGATEAHLARALSGVLLMLLCGDTDQAVWLTPGIACVPHLAQALRQKKLGRIQRLLQQGDASTLLDPSRSCSDISSSRTVQGQQLLPLGLLSPGVQARLEQVCQTVLQQVLLCCTWADAAVAPAARTPSLCGSTGPGGQCGRHPTPFEWQRLVQSLQQAAESAAEVCQLQQRQQHHQPPDAYLCPISRELMCDPVVACDGHTYERHAITEWIQVCAARCVRCKSPMTSLPMAPNLVPNHTLKSLIKDWQEQQV